MKKYYTIISVYTKLFWSTFSWAFWKFTHQIRFTTFQRVCHNISSQDFNSRPNKVRTGFRLYASRVNQSRLPKRKPTMVRMYWIVYNHNISRTTIRSINQRISSKCLQRQYIDYSQGRIKLCKCLKCTMMLVTGMQGQA